MTGKSCLHEFDRRSVLRERPLMSKKEQRQQQDALKARFATGRVLNGSFHKGGSFHGNGSFKYKKKEGYVMNVTSRRKAVAGAFVLAVLLIGFAFPVLASEGGDYVPTMYASFWALVPPVVAIALALITKEVYSSLFIGILVGGIFYSGFSFEGTVNHVLQGGIISVLSDA